MPRGRRGSRLTPGRAIRAAATAAAALGAFGLLAHHVTTGRRFGWDTHLLASVGAVENSVFEGAMVLFSFLGAGVGLLLLMTPLLLWLLRRRRVADVLFVCTSLLVAQVLGRLAKDGIGEPRPPRPDREELHALTDLRAAVIVIVGAAILVALATRWRGRALAFSAVLTGALLVFQVLGPAIYPVESRSFPSGHATSSMAFVAAAATLAWPTRRRWPAVILGGAFAALVGLSRVALEVHYPSDVLGGWTLSIACVAVVWLVVRALGPGEGRPAAVDASPQVSGSGRRRSRRTFRRGPAGSATHSPSVAG
jgi:membrane-associated phospholipid phosphatase